MTHERRHRVISELAPPITLDEARTTEPKRCA